VLLVGVRIYGVHVVSHVVVVSKLKHGEQHGSHKMVEQLVLVQQQEVKNVTQVRVLQV
jgi:hypothetical protein